MFDDFHPMDAIADTFSSAWNDMGDWMNDTSVSMYNGAADLFGFSPLEGSMPGAEDRASFNSNSNEPPAVEINSPLICSARELMESPGKSITVCETHSTNFKSYGWVQEGGAPINRISHATRFSPNGGFVDYNIKLKLNDQTSRFTTSGGMCETFQKSFVKDVEGAVGFWGGGRYSYVVSNPECEPSCQPVTYPIYTSVTWVDSEKDADAVVNIMEHKNKNESLQGFVDHSENTINLFADTPWVFNAHEINHALMGGADRYDRHVGLGRIQFTHPNGGWAPPIRTNSNIPNTSIMSNQVGSHPIITVSETDYYSLGHEFQGILRQAWDNPDLTVSFKRNGGLVDNLFVFEEINKKDLLPEQQVFPLNTGVGVLNSLWQTFSNTTATLHRSARQIGLPL